MQASGHITAETAEGYRHRLLPPPELLAAQAHAARCEACRARLAGAAGLDAAFAKVHEEFAAGPGRDEEPEHLPYEQLAAFVDGSLDEVTREIAESHLAVCAGCAGDAEDLRQYQTISAAAPVGLNAAGGASPAKAPGAWRRLLSSLNVIPSPRVLVPTAAVAAIVAATLFGLWVASRRGGVPSDSERIARTTSEGEHKTGRSETRAPEANPAESPTPSPTTESMAHERERRGELAALPTQTKTMTPRPGDRTASPDAGASHVALNDGGGKVVLDARGGLRGLESLSPEARVAVRRSLETRRVETPRVLDALAAAESGVLMSGATNGGEQAGVPFTLVGPVGRVVLEDRPVLRWRPLAGAASYRASVVDSNFQIVAESERTDANEWAPPVPLVRGRTYYWQVTATLADGEEVISPRTPAPRAKFRVLDAHAADELRRLEEAAPESHLARGVLYARAGLVVEAEAEFRKLVTLNPRSPVARKLLRSVSTDRRRP